MDKQIKNILGMTLIGALVIFGLSTVFVTRSYTKSVNPASTRSFMVSGEGKVLAVPDIATFSFGVISEGGDDLQALQSQNIEKLNKTITFLKDNGVAEEDIQTSGYNVNPRYQYFDCRSEICKPPSIIGYEVTQRVRVRVREINTAGLLLSGVVDQGANNVSSLNFEIEEPIAYENQARQEAIAKAKSQAEATADAGGFRLGKLISIDESNMGMPMMARMESFDVANDQAEEFKVAPTIEPGSNEVVVQVTLRYEIK